MTDRVYDEALRRAIFDRYHNAMRAVPRTPETAERLRALRRKAEREPFDCQAIGAAHTPVKELSASLRSFCVDFPGPPLVAVMFMIESRHPDQPDGARRHLAMSTEVGKGAFAFDDFDFVQECMGFAPDDEHTRGWASAENGVASLHFTQPLTAEELAAMGARHV
jgi:hypothetical protein